MQNRNEAENHKRNDALQTVKIISVTPILQGHFLFSKNMLNYK